MSDAIMEKNAQKAAQLLGQSRYRVDIHGCNDFLDVLSFSAEEALSKPWYYDIALTCENPDNGPEFSHAVGFWYGGVR